MQVAIAAVHEAGAQSLDYFRARERLTIERKGLQDLVSEADREVEVTLRRRLRDAFPDDGVLGEEQGGELDAKLWVLDPIDGTANFLRGLPYWCVAVAFAVDGEPDLALTYDAVHDELFTAVRGEGAQRNGSPIHVSERTDPAESCLGLTFSFKASPGSYEALVGRLAAHRLDHRRLGSSALSLCHVADGRLDGLVCPGCNSWDVLGGLLLVTEAGGVATRYTDGATLLERRGVRGSNAGLAALVGEVAGVG